MSISLTVVSHGMTLSKEEWRRPGQRRTLAPIDPAPHTMALHRALMGAASASIASAELEGEALIHMRVAPLKRHHGIFELSPGEGPSVRILLREEECSRRYGTPRRRTHAITTLEPWRTARILINGRLASYSGQTYLIHEFYWTLCAGPVPAVLASPATFDLQADLS